MRKECEEQRRNEAVSHVLITSISRKVPLIRAVRRAARRVDERIRVYGGDADAACIGRYFVDDFWHMPKLDVLSKDRLIEWCLERRIGVIIPTRDGELEYFASLREELGDRGIHVMVSAPSAVRVCVDKLLFYEHGKLHRLPVIPTAESLEQLEEEAPDAAYGEGRYVVKERFGAGSAQLGLNLDRETAAQHALNLDHPVFQPYVRGREASVDLYVTRLGTVKGCIARYREVVMNGESQVTTTFSDPVLERMCAQFARTLNLYGHVVFQVIVTKQGEYRFVECNCRFGGASTLSVDPGLDSFCWLLLEARGADVDSGEYPFIRRKKRLRMIRHAQDLFLEL